MAYDDKGSTAGRDSIFESIFEGKAFGDVQTGGELLTSPEVTPEA